jgi:Cna protein B-type domain.
MIAAAQSGRSWMNGIVFDESDTQGISSARVELIGDPDSPRLQAIRLTTNTDERGKYSFKDVPYGDYTFRVSAAGFTPYEIKLYIASDALTELHVKLKKQK